MNIDFRQTGVSNEVKRGRLHKAGEKRHIEQSRISFTDLQSYGKSELRRIDSVGL